LAELRKIIDFQGEKKIFRGKIDFPGKINKLLGKKLEKELKTWFLISNFSFSHQDLHTHLILKNIIYSTPVTPVWAGGGVEGREKVPLITFFVRSFFGGDILHCDPWDIFSCFNL